MHGNQGGTILLEGPFESDYSLAIVNRRLAGAFLKLGVPIRLFQRDNTTAYPPSTAFLEGHPELAQLFLDRLPDSYAAVHSRYIYPPYTDRFAGTVRAVHCYGWEESGFPQRYVEDFNRELHVITVMSGYVRDVLRANGVRVPIAVVGLGADHVLDCAPKPATGIDTAGFVFLHVSSCFPRKAPEVLVQAFCEEFTRRDDVRLVIKTFANPHNRIAEIVKESEARWPSHAPIEIVSRSLDAAEMRWLYERAGCVVSASRGEGFGLPAAEAMLLGRPVVATRHGGQADICPDGGCWPVDYRIEPARTHLTEGASHWAEPDLPSLRAQLRSVYQAADSERSARTRIAREFVSQRFTWAGVAERHRQACQELPCEQEPLPSTVSVSFRGCRIGFVTTWNARCGIAEYARYLAGSLPPEFGPMVFASEAEKTVRPDEEYVTRCWAPDGGAGVDSDTRLIDAILRSGVEAVSVQFNFGFFSPARLARLTEALRREGIVTAVTMHATHHENLGRLKSALAAVDFCVCHRREDVEALEALGLDNVVLQRQGIPVAHPGRPPEAAPRRPALGFVLACFGFFLPPKGIHQLVEAVALARAVEPLLHLKLLNALYPIPESQRYAEWCLRLAREMGLAGSLSVTTDFLDDEAVLAELGAADLVVLPYVYSSESSSAAIRLPVASLTPVLCSDLRVFDEFRDCVHRYPAGDPLALANAIVRLARDPSLLRRTSDRQRQTAAGLAWPVIAREFAQRLEARLCTKPTSRNAGGVGTAPTSEGPRN
jgi:glycosyltransferase involved in cell wall biosynthesis